MASLKNSRANRPAKNVPFYTPIQDPPAGTPRNTQHPSLFSPIKIRGLTVHNRIVVSPMCQYSSLDGYATPWHESLIGSLAARGPGLIMMEAHSVVPEGRITPEDAGIWDDGHIESLRRIVEFAHSQGVKIGIQLQHAGRKASRQAPWLRTEGLPPKESLGWPDSVVSCGADPFSAKTCVPREMTKKDIEELKANWVAAVKRALKAGFDTIMFQAAFGYLIHSFLSPATNHRSDEYGGSFENRIRLLLELVKLTRAEVPKDFPLCVRMPATDHLEHLKDAPQWTIDEAAKLAKILADSGVDVLDISSGGLDPRQKMKLGKGHGVQFSSRIKEAVAGSEVVVGVSGEITQGKQAQDILDTKSADVVVVGRKFLKDPNLVWHWADELGVKIHVASQFGWAFGITRNSKL